MADLGELDAQEQRILGSLLEKQQTVPATYPLSMSALRAACNQTSSRDPVTAYDEPLLEEALRRLRHRDLVRVVWSDTGRRTLRYLELLAEQLALQPDERALVTVLLLRGAQSPGELRTRTERLHPFADRESVEACLQRLAGRPTPLVRQLERRVGQQDRRWVHLLGPVEVSGAPADTRGHDASATEMVLAEGPAARDARVVAAYDQVASDYAETYAEELTARPFDRWLLARVAELAGDAPVADVGVGPGHTTRFLADAGADVIGYDLAPAMVAEAGRRFPGLTFTVGDLTRLPRPPAASGWGAVVSWYSLVHLAASELAPAIAALTRPLRDGGWLALALHAIDLGAVPATGQTAGPLHHATTWFDHDVDLHFVVHDRDRVLAAVEAAGLVDVEWYLRGPDRSRDETTVRLHVLARRPLG